MISKKKIFFYFILAIYIHWGKTLDAFENQHRNSLNMCILTQLLIFAFRSFLKQFFKLEPLNLVQLKH